MIEECSKKYTFLVTILYFIRRKNPLKLLVLKGFYISKLSFPNKIRAGLSF